MISIGGNDIRGGSRSGEVNQAGAENKFAQSQSVDIGMLYYCVCE